MTATPVARPRTRAYKPKARTGCKTCKIRKIKCDETKPHCKRCTATGRTCDGYDPGFVPPRHSPPTRTPFSSPPQSESKAVLQPRDSQDRVSLALEVTTSPAFLLPLLRLESDDERIGLQFYVRHAGPALARSSNPAFWQRQILQAAHQHASVQHCIIALGAMYRRFFESRSTTDDADSSSQQFRFALSQSNKAIQLLLEEQIEAEGSSVANKLTAMTCCVLFGSMASLQGQRNAARDHLRSGIRMLKETKLQYYNDRNSHPVNINSLRSLFTGLDIQARATMSWNDSQTWEPVPQTMRRSEPVDIDISCPWALSELHCRIETLLNDTLAFNRSCVGHLISRDDVEITHASLVTRFRRISNTLDALRTIIPRINSPADDSSKAILLVAETYHWLRSAVEPLQRHFNIISPLSKVPYDPAEHFTKMIPHIKHLLSFAPPLTPVYSAAPGPLSALWRIATSAPSSCVALRREALALIAKHPRREGNLDGRLVGQIGKVAWGLEQSAARRELGLGDYVEGGEQEDLIVPDHLRLNFMDIEWDKDDEQWAKIRVANAMQNGYEGGGTVFTIRY